MIEYYPPPERCQLCQGEFNGVMYDCKTDYGPWGNLCARCFRIHGVGLGLGKGQKYVQQVTQYVGEDTVRIRWLKTGG